MVLLPVFLFAQKGDSAKQKTPVAVFPALSFSPETSLQFGAAAVWVLENPLSEGAEFKRQSTISPFFIYTLKNQIITATNFTYFNSRGNLLDGSVRFFNFPDSYFGIGNDNDPDVFETYTNTFFQAQGSYLKLISMSSFLGVAWDGQYNAIRKVIDGGMLDMDNLTGTEGGFLLGVGPAYRVDTRNNNIYPTKGNFVTLQALFYYLGDYSYSSYLIDARKYVSLWDDKNILAFQFSSSFTAGNEVPFYKLPQLGGDSRLRGIANASLYRDRQMTYAQVEYRRPLFWRFGMTAFAGAGDVAGSIDGFSISEFKYVVGMGGRFAAIPEDKLNLRVDLGVARGGQVGFYVGISEAF